MAFRGETVLAVVPARGGSKAIPRKNLATIAGRSLVAHAAGVAAALDWLDAAVLSSDDDEIIAEAERHGLAAPFRRPADLAGDASGSVPMWQHAWRAAEAHYGMTFAISVLLEPTSPLRRPEDVAATVARLIDSGRAGAATLSPTPAHFTPHKTLSVADDGTIGFYRRDGARHARRQTVPDYYHRNGVCYALRRETLLDRGALIEHDCAAVIIERPIVNIDDPFDLELAEWLIRRSDRSSCSSESAGATGDSDA